MTDKPADVVDFKSRNKLDAEEAIARDEKGRAAYEEQYAAQVASEAKEAAIEVLDKVRGLIDRGVLENLIIVSQHKEKGYFFTDMCFGPDGCEPHTAYSWVGALDVLKNEMAEIAVMAPAVMPDGSLNEVIIDEILPDGDIA